MSPFSVKSRHYLLTLGTRQKGKCCNIYIPRPRNVSIFKVCNGCYRDKQQTVTTFFTHKFFDCCHVFEIAILSIATISIAKFPDK